MSRTLGWITEELRELASQGLLRHRRNVQPLSAGWCDVGGRRVLNFASNDYLNLAGDPRVIAAATQALAEAGVGARASALVCGRGPWHERLEHRLAEFEGQPAAILFPTGMAANVGTVAALAGPGDVVLCDRLNHASLVDGCRLSRATLRIYRHDDLTVVARELAQAVAAKRRWIVTDSVFSMDGDLAPLAELCELAQHFEAGLIVDEAHGTGVFGTHGRGASEALGVEMLIDVRIGTLSKALGSLGGFVTGSQELIDFLWNRARSQVYSTALPPALCAAAIASLEIITNEPERRVRLSAASVTFRQMLLESGIIPQPNSRGPIVPIPLSDPQAAVRVANRLQEQGFLVGAIRPPTVPHGTSRLRIVVTAAHSDDDLKRLAAAVHDAVSRDASIH